MNKDLIKGLVFNVLILVCTVIGTIIMLNNTESATGLTASGWENLKYFTVLSNEFAGIAALIVLMIIIFGRASSMQGFISVIKLIAVTGVGLTFMVIACFFGPLYGYLILYQGSNLWFHLIVPVICMVEFVFLDTGREGIRLKFIILAGLPSLCYGMFYLINILVNGVGTWPDGNDWYGFVNWGLPVGIVIFAGIVLMSIGLAALFRWINKKVMIKKYEE